MTMFELSNSDTFVAVLSDMPEDIRMDSDYEGFGDFDAARVWAENHIRESVNSFGTGGAWRVDVVRMDRDDYAADTWTVEPDATVARAGWDAAAGAVTWQFGPFADR
ncbi:hypothetical protein ACFYTQ_28165 [Nocardia sp. NPDC004068]|uniref:hypothetical protein n=1 Tax=Nocardia sp. NPDC004068 TaxID=3364303 RepID=UPI00369A4CAD